MNMERSLNELRNGERGVITIVGNKPHKGSDPKRRGFKRRLIDLGLTPGTEVTMVKSAPLHGPLEIIVRGSRLAIGRRMASRIFVEVSR
jgi:Fe2+ transport system protein FeoA